MFEAVPTNVMINVMLKVFMFLSYLIYVKVNKSMSSNFNSAIPVDSSVKSRENNIDPMLRFFGSKMRLRKRQEKSFQRIEFF